MPLPSLAAAAPIVGSAIGAIGSFFSGKSAADAAERQYKHRYQWQVKDLQKAGLNPMLAVSNSPGTPAQPDTPNIGEAAVKGYSAGAAAKLLAEQYQTQKAVTNKTMAETDRIGMENLMVEASPLYQSAKEAHDPSTGAIGGSALAADKFKAEVDVLKNTGSKLAADTDLARLNADLAKGEIDLQQIKLRYSDQLAKIETRYREAMARAEELKIPLALAEASFWADAGELGKLAVFIKSLVR